MGTIRLLWVKCDKMNYTSRDQIIFWNVHLVFLFCFSWHAHQSFLFFFFNRTTKHNLILSDLSQMPSSFSFRLSMYTFVHFPTFVCCPSSTVRSWTVMLILQDIRPQQARRTCFNYNKCIMTVDAPVSPYPHNSNGFDGGSWLVLSEQ